MPPRYGHLIRVLHSCCDQTMSGALASMELTAAQGPILGFIFHQQRPPCPRDVEEAFHLSHPTVSGILSRLEQKGFIRLQTDPEDRRCKRIHILEKGRQCHDVMHQTIQHNEKRIVTGFTPEEQELFCQMLQRAITNMGGSFHHPGIKEEDNE